MRSMASVGSWSGLAQATSDVVRVLDAAGFDIIIVETVGAGQAEVEIVHTSAYDVVVEVPGLGDDVQAIKAGILEIADVFVVNKADRPEAEKGTCASPVDAASRRCCASMAGADPVDCRDPWRACR